MTNSEKIREQIRNMTDEQLASLIKLADRRQKEWCDIHSAYPHCEFFASCTECCLAWLKQEATE